MCVHNSVDDITCRYCVHRACTVCWGIGQLYLYCSNAHQRVCSLVNVIAKLKLIVNYQPFQDTVAKQNPTIYIFSLEKPFVVCNTLSKQPTASYPYFKLSYKSEYNADGNISYLHCVYFYSCQGPNITILYSKLITQ